MGLQYHMGSGGLLFTIRTSHHLSTAAGKKARSSPGSCHFRHCLARDSLCRHSKPWLGQVTAGLTDQKQVSGPLEL